MNNLKPCPFCGCPVNFTSDNGIFGWHDNLCFFQLLDEYEVDMDQQELGDAFIIAWNRRANDG